MMMRYRNRPDLVPPVTSDGFHHTGDLFEVDDQGFFWFAGREDDVFKCGGETVYPQAVEEALEAHPAVLSAVVLPVPDALKGRKPVAFVLVSPGFEFDERALQQHVLGRLEPFAHPRRIWPLDAFPLAAANKVDRKRLAEAALLACAEERPGPPAATRRSGRAE
jgi:acyl-CoA synthetase (AMP-forming)/AMP-acid ligase II